MLINLGVSEDEIHLHESEDELGGWSNNLHGVDITTILYYVLSKDKAIEDHSTDAEPCSQNIITLCNVWCKIG